MARYRFFQLDVFANTPLAGNPLAVFPDGPDLPAATLQAIAREMNLSETTFVYPSSRGDRRVRFFTPTAEIPLAGHPTIGTWWLLAELGEVDLSKERPTDVTQETGAGVLPVTIEGRDGAPTLVTMTQAEPAFGPVVDDIDGLATALGAPDGAVIPSPPPQVVSTALPQLMVPVRDDETLRALPSGGRGMDLAAALTRYDTDCAMCFSLTGHGARCRMFAPALGVPEDPATGSAAGALGAYLVRHRLVPTGAGATTIDVHQGEEIGRPSRIRVTVDGAADAITRVRVGGEAVRIIEGSLTLRG